VQVELLQLAGGTGFCGVWAVLEVLVFVMVAPPQMELPGWGALVSVALVEVSLARTGAVGSARTIGVPADTITKASSSEFQTGFIFTFINSIRPRAQTVRHQPLPRLLARQR